MKQQDAALQVRAVQMPSIFLPAHIAVARISLKAKHARFDVNKVAPSASTGPDTTRDAQLKTAGQGLEHCEDRQCSLISPEAF